MHERFLDRARGACTPGARGDPRVLLTGGVELAGTSVLVVGGSSGMGLATAAALGRRGVCVVVAARDPERGAAAARSVGAIYRQAESAIVRARGASPDAREGVTSFLERRAAQFPGLPSEELEELRHWWAAPPFEMPADHGESDA